MIGVLMMLSHSHTNVKSKLLIQGKFTYFTLSNFCFPLKLKVNIVLNESAWKIQICCYAFPNPDELNHDTSSVA